MLSISTFLNENLIIQPLVGMATNAAAGHLMKNAAVSTAVNAASGAIANGASKVVGKVAPRAISNLATRDAVKDATAFGANYRVSAETDNAVNTAVQSTHQFGISQDTIDRTVSKIPGGFPMQFLARNALEDNQGNIMLAQGIGQKLHDSLPQMQAIGQKMKQTAASGGQLVQPHLQAAGNGVKNFLQGIGNKIKPDQMDHQV